MESVAQPPVGTRQNGTFGYIDFPRDVTAQTRENAYAAYNHLAVQRVQAIGFNFSGTDYLNSAGIGLIISLVEDATAAGRKVFAYGLNSHNRKLFRMVGLTERLTLVADEAEMHAKLVPPEPPAAPEATVEAAPPSEPETQPEPQALPRVDQSVEQAPQAESQALPEVEQPAAEQASPKADA
jgi:anti-anti-sigma regulatory factor